MMLLAAAADWAALHSDRVPPAGFGSRVVRRRIELAGDGRLLQLVDLATMEQKTGQRRTVPNLDRSGTQAPALLVCDKASYVFGPSPATAEKDIAKATAQHARYLDGMQERSAALA